METTLFHIVHHLRIVPFGDVEIQVDGTLGRTVSLVENHIELVVDHEDRTAVSQPRVGRILQHQRLVPVARARFGELFEQFAVARNVLAIERDGVVGRRSGVFAA